MIYLFYIPAGLLIIQGIFSLIEGVRFYGFIRRAIKEPAGGFTPFASIIAPCKGIDSGLEENLHALFEQDYPDYEIIFAVASDDDPARQVIERVIKKYPGITARLIVSGYVEGRGEKVNNLLSALTCVDSKSEALAFVDSDARVRHGWLRLLVSALEDNRVGAATGYRWYLPDKGGFWSALLSAWNGSIATTLGDHRGNFAWGGSTAILRETFNQLGIADRWQRVVSDDYALTRAVKDGNLYVRFVPRCLTISREDFTLKSLFEFTTRQIIITRVYSSKAWWVGMISNCLFSITFWGGLAMVLLAALRGEGIIWPLMMLGAIFLLGSIKGALRLAGAVEALPSARDEIKRLWWMYCLLWSLVSLLFLCNFIRSAVTRRITWRGVTYELRSADETRIEG